MEDLVQPTTHQADEDAKELDDVGVSDGVEPAEEGVKDGDAGAEDDGYALVHVHDDRQGGPQSGEDARGPENFAAESWQEQQPAHSLPEGVLEGVQHGDVPLLAHLVGEEDAALEQTSTLSTLSRERVNPFALGLKCNTENEAECVTEGSLAPDEASRVNCLRGPVDVTPADPGRRHRENPDEKANRSAGLTFRVYF